MLSWRGMSCCGMVEALDFNNSTPEDVIRAAYYYYNDQGGRFMSAIFSEAREMKSNLKNGDAFMEYVEENGLGQITYVDEMKNPNSGNYVLPILWRPHWTNVNKLGKKLISAKKKAA